MSNIDTTLNIELRGEAALKAQATCGEQIAAWGIGLPEVKPLLLDFGLGDFYKTGLVEFWIANEIRAGYCGKYMFVFAGQRCPMHRHREKLETFCIVKGTAVMTYDGREFEMKPGNVLTVERRKYHSFVGKGPCLLLEISTPCIIADNYFENTAIPVGGNYKGE
ncbi:MAG: D-lyxose/D-mannose family sugar isomerase [Victivallaceae bacterium]|nr:D-lyxose/D-mannose family sugar isomerase [Victivallaceae bacterium]